MNHHYVPELYLACWGNNERKFLRHQVIRGRVIRDLKTPGQVCYEKDLYVFDGAGAEYRHFIETQIYDRKIENFVAPLMTKLIEAKESSFKFSANERILWSRFVLSLRLRTPEITHRLKTQGPEDFRRALNEVNEEYQKRAPEGAPENFSDWLDQTQPGHLERIAMRIIPKLLFEMDTPKHIYGMDWWLRDFSTTDIEIATCDRPCFFFGKSKQDDDASRAVPSQTLPPMAA